MEFIPSILALLIAIAGWFYMFYSKAAHRLSGYEDEKLNRRRIMLRRIGGFMMLLMAVAFYAGFETVGHRRSPVAFVYIWVAVAVMMVIILALGLIDMRLTLQLRRRK